MLAITSELFLIMVFSIAVILVCLFVGATGVALANSGDLLTWLLKMFSRISNQGLKHYSPRNALFIIGPSAKHAACRYQRRLLKPALAALISKDVSIIEAYGNATPQMNGQKIAWLDSTLLRHGMNVETGFHVIYVDENGQTLFKSEAPMVASDILKKLNFAEPKSFSNSPSQSRVLKKLRTA